MTISNEEALETFDFKIYPNPTTTNDKSVYIEWTSDKYLNGTINLYDTCGQLIRQQPLTANNYTEIDISQLSAGLYLASIQETGNIQRKLIIQ